jgi:hypothetical protein
VVRQLAVTAAVAATAQKSKREAAFSKITKSPTPAACIELLEAEKLGSDFSLRSIDDIKKVINKRKAG